MGGTGGDPISRIFERLTPTVGVTFLRVGVTLGGGYLDGVTLCGRGGGIRGWGHQVREEEAVGRGVTQE